jgi:hypothetical protein
MLDLPEEHPKRLKTPAKSPVFSRLELELAQQLLQYNEERACNPLKPRDEHTSNDGEIGSDKPLPKPRRVYGKVNARVVSAFQW